MNHRQTVETIARHLPHLRRHTVAEVLEVAAEIWAAELARPGGRVTLADLGRLQIEVQQMRVAGAVRDRLEAERGAAPATLRRIYYRFRPSGRLREQVEAGHAQTQDEG